MADQREFQILMVEDEPLFAQGIEQILGLEGYTVHSADSGESALAKMKWKKYDLILSDLMLPGISGMALLKICHDEKINTPFVMMTAYATVSTAVEAMKLGANGYYIKGNSLEELIEEVRVVYQGWQRTQYLSEARTNLAAELLESNSTRFKQIVEIARKASRSSASVLLLGESGVGKEVFANFIHEESLRSKGKLVAVNCQALSDQVLESELFGHVKGAFTGASEDRMGRFEAADQGTLFLDEIADVPLATQVKLLRVLESKKFERLGANESIFSDYRLITATNKNIKDLIEHNGFREDFYYRISTVIISIPPLRERLEDLPKLTRYFIQETCAVMEIEPCQISDEALDALKAYHFPGNIRELKNIVQRLVIFNTGGVITLEDLSVLEEYDEWISPSPTPDYVGHNLRDYRALTERQFILKHLEIHDFSMTKTASAIGISRRQLLNKMKALDIDKQLKE